MALREPQKILILEARHADRFVFVLRCARRFALARKPYRKTLYKVTRLRGVWRHTVVPRSRGNGKFKWHIFSTAVLSRPKWRMVPLRSSHVLPFRFCVSKFNMFKLMLTYNPDIKSRYLGNPPRTTPTPLEIFK